jgi:hypothetical protein
MMWVCACDCGNVVTVESKYLRRGLRTQCPECSYRARRLDRLGEEHGRLTVTRMVGATHKGHVLWECRCRECHSVEHRTQFVETTDCQTCRAADRVHAKADRTAARIAAVTVTVTSECPVCGDTFTRSSLATPTRYCSPECSVKRRRAVRRHLVRAREKGVPAELIHLVDSYSVFERDDWMCQFCGVEAPRHLRGTQHSLAPELDHRIPLSWQGPNMDTNTRCVHKVCNEAKAQALERSPAVFEMIHALPFARA